MKRNKKNSKNSFCYICCFLKALTKRNIALNIIFMPIISKFLFLDYISPLMPIFYIQVPYASIYMANRYLSLNISKIELLTTYIKLFPPLVFLISINETTSHLIVYIKALGALYRIMKDPK